MPAFECPMTNAGMRADSSAATARSASKTVENDASLVQSEGVLVTMRVSDASNARVARYAKRRQCASERPTEWTLTCLDEDTSADVTSITIRKALRARRLRSSHLDSCPAPTVHSFRGSSTHHARRRTMQILRSTRLTLLVAAAALSAASPAFAQSRRNDRYGNDHVPPGHYPPAGMCRVWIDGVPPGHQPAPTD